METINLYDAKTNLSQLVERAARGEEIIIAKAGRPLARLVPLATRTEPRPLGLFRGQAEIGDEFDKPLPDAMAAAFRGEGE
jgi:prevent-host-death family protein